MIENNDEKKPANAEPTPTAQPSITLMAPSASRETYHKFGQGIPEVVNIITRKDKGIDVAPLEYVKAAQAAFARNPNSLVPLTPFLRLAGKPYTLTDHFFMEPVFRVRCPKVTVLKCARQLSKSTSMAAESVLRSVCHDDLRTMFVTPRFEQVRKLSQNYVKPFVNSPLIRATSLSEECSQGVLQRSFTNRSTIFFAFAFLDADRIRGVSTDLNKVDEVQDFNWEFIPIIQECMSASAYELSMYSGTPKTLDNTLEKLWSDSTKAEWVTKCDHCGRWNMASVGTDLLKMIGLKTVVCAKCDLPINPRDGHWVHTDPLDPKGKTKYRMEQGFHVPQVIVPVHYNSPEKWIALTSKRDGKQGYTKQKFWNEVLGESDDLSVRLTTISDIKKASKLGVNKLSNELFQNFKSRCQTRALAVDWGGGGIDETSFTACALIGMNTASNVIECYFCDRFTNALTHNDEVDRLLELFHLGQCQIFAHDFGGAGNIRETMMINAGLPTRSIANIMYSHHPENHLMYYNNPRHGESRGYYSLDKSRSLVLQATCIKSSSPLILLPEYESSKHITCDLLNLIEEKKDNPYGSDIYLVHRKPKETDDFAHALNMGACALWHHSKKWPDLAKVTELKMSKKQLKFMNPPATNVRDWQDKR